MVPAQPDHGKLVVATALLDEYWFFHNVVSRSLPLDRRRQSVHVSSPSNIVLKEHLCPSEVLSPTPPLPLLPPVARDDNRALLRMPSLPPARDGADPCPSKLLNRKLQRTCSSFEGHSKHSSPESMSPNKPSTRRKQWIQDNKKIEGARRFGRLERWMSLSDLEWFEVQGCKDLGFFVFGKEAGGMDPRLERVIPGINRDRSPAAGVVDEKVISRPYLAESWLVNRSAPPPTVSRWRERGASADDMKEQLRFWARAVACNVRQD